MKVVVIGGQGFIGAEIVRALLATGKRVTVVDLFPNVAKCDALFGTGSVDVVRADIVDAEAMRKVTWGAEEVYHLAGKLGTSELDDDVITGINVNITGAVNVFAACVQNEVSTVFYASKPNVWLNTYTITKFAAEQFTELYGANGASRICGLRYFNAYGPHQATGPVRKIIPAFAGRAMNHLPIEVYGDGEQIVDMVYAEDLGRITVDFVTKTDTRGVLDLGRGIGLSVNQIAEAVNAYFGSKAGIHHLPMRRGETPGTILVADIAPLERAIGPLAFADWEKSLAKTLQWYADLAFAMKEAS